MQRGMRPRVRAGHCRDENYTPRRDGAAMNALLIQIEITDCGSTGRIEHGQWLWAEKNKPHKAACIFTLPAEAKAAP